MLGDAAQLRGALIASTGTTVAVLVALMVALGVGMIAVAVWLIRSTRSDHPALGPLETMGDRRFRRASTDRRATRLAAARPPGAPEPAPIVPLDDEPVEEPPEASSSTENGEPSEQESASTAHSSATEQQPEAP